MWQPDVGGCGASRRWVGHVPGIDGVESLKVVHVGVEDRRLHQVGQGCAGCGEDGAQVQKRLFGLGFDALRDRSGGGVDPGRSGAEDEAAGDDRLAVRSKRGRCALARDRLSGHGFPSWTFRKSNVRGASAAGAINVHYGVPTAGLAGWSLFDAGPGRSGQGSPALVRERLLRLDKQGGPDLGAGRAVCDEARDLYSTTRTQLLDQTNAQQRRPRGNVHMRPGRRVQRPSTRGRQPQRGDRLAARRGMAGSCHDEALRRAASALLVGRLRTTSPARRHGRACLRLRAFRRLLGIWLMMWSSVPGLRPVCAQRFGESRRVVADA